VAGAVTGLGALGLVTTAGFTVSMPFITRQWPGKVQM